MIWILIASLSYGQYGITAEFNSQQACETAKTVVMQTWQGRATCVPKGEKK